MRYYKKRLFISLPNEFSFCNSQILGSIKKKTEITDKAQGRTILPAIERNASKNAQEELD